MEDFVNYKVPSMFLITSICDWKCCKEANIDISICQNQSLVKQPTKTYSYESIYQAYVNNPITKAMERILVLLGETGLPVLIGGATTRVL